MTNRPRYTTAQLARFITLARGGRDRRTAALLDDDERNTVPVTDSLGRQQDATRYLDADEKGVTTADTLGGAQQISYVTEAGKHRTTRTPPLLNADGTPADTLPTTTPEDHA
ncbi:hypothetical protein M3C18_009405 [Micrococcus luteus]|uniref:hypothetical protein n=1 Tax=Micrococcus luteus TaxID=1270 RepID=UPI001E2F5527|nr:hypothetical protein [Micrococcus luteus]MCD0182893.1 hypothetical protein [Micrococcus luteus]MCV7661119.1 hypothetical protein [Micrococcus luteus]